MTYGWAILIVIIVGAALYALGVFNPGTFTGHKSTGFSATQMNDFKFDDAGNLTMKIGNRYGRTIVVMQVNATYGGALDCKNATAISPMQIGPNEGTTATIGLISVCGTGTWTKPSQGASYSIPVKIQYRDPETNTNHTDIGTVSGSVEPA